MNNKEAASVIGVLVVNTNGWTDETSTAWMAQIIDWQYEPAAQAARAVSDTWEGYGKPPFSALKNQYLAAIKRQRMSTPIIGRQHCDGSGWMDGGELGYRPCPQCNPYTAGLWRDESTRSQYLEGRKMSDISDEVMAQNGMMHGEHGMPNQCGTTYRDDPDDRQMSAAAGRALAKKTYLDDCERRGVKPSAASLRTLESIGKASA